MPARASATTWAKFSSATMALDCAAAGLRRFQRAMDAGHGDKDMAASFLV
ncbi:hypothetical protein [Chromobacterium subtsugae]|nr:hypothetical protein [Chromobacterium subtsugae]